jgi:hypothetical protein
MFEALTRKYGPLPGWAWGLIVAGVAYWYLVRRKKQQAAAAAAAAQAQGLSSNLGTVPVSNLTTSAEPMPIQMGDTFVNVPQSISQTVTPTTPITINEPPAQPLQPAPVPTVSPVVQTVPVQTLPGYGAGLGDLLNLNPGLLSANTPGGQNVPGITGYNVSYNGVPL